MRYATYLFALLCIVALTSCAASPGRVLQTEPVAALNAHEMVGIKGYDAVSYFVNGKPEKGTAEFTTQWQGARWHFASAEHRDLFLANPQKYAPQFGGYCAFAVSRGTTADIDPKQWAVVNGKLYLNNNSFAQSLWNRERPGNIAAGEINWPLIPKIEEEY